MNGEVAAVGSFAKDYLPFPVYVYMCKYLWKKCSKGFDVLFATICWNTLMRSDNVVGIALTHLEWDNDCIVLTIPRSKGDQSGAEEKLSKKHIYANPLNPAICPALAIGNLCFYE